MQWLQSHLSHLGAQEAVLYRILWSAGSCLLGLTWTQQRQHDCPSQAAAKRLLMHMFLATFCYENSKWRSVGLTGKVKPLLFTNGLSMGEGGDQEEGGEQEEGEGCPIICAASATHDEC